MALPNSDVAAPNTKRRTRGARGRRKTTAGVRPGTATGVGNGSIGASFGPMHKAAGHDLANIVYGFSLGRGIAPKQAVQYLNTLAETW